MSINLELSDSVLMNLNAVINGAQADSLSALQAWTSRTDENATGLCGLPCANTCNVCVKAEADLTAFYAPSAPAEEQVVIQAMALATPGPRMQAPAGDETTDEQWEDAARNARALDEIEAANRTGMWADDGAEDQYDNDDCQYYDDRQDDYYDDGDCGLDWNESGYFD